MSAYTQARDELAAECRNRPDRTVTIAEARTYIDAEVIHQWSLSQLKTRSHQQLMLEAFELMTTDQTIEVWVSLPHASKDDARRILAAAQAEHVARDLVQDAQDVIDTYDPTDDEVARMQADRSVRAEYRAMARADAAHYRRTGEYLGVL
jgi:hypothetical protein